MSERNPGASTERQRSARLRPEHAKHYPALLAGEWYRVFERHPDPTDLSTGGKPLPGYIWIEAPGKLRHVWAAHFEVRERKPGDARGEERAEGPV
jgi:hypothetical protein